MSQENKNRSVSQGFESHPANAAGQAHTAAARTADGRGAGVSLAEITRQNRQKEEGDAAARRALNALAVTSHLVSALIEHPGALSNHDSMVKAAREMIKSGDATSQAIVEELGLGGISWAPYRIMRMVSEAVASRWAASARNGAPTADVSDLLPVWREISSCTLPELSYEAPAGEPAAALRIALLDAMQPVMQEISIFDMLHDPKEAAAHARDHILVTAQRALAAFAAEPMSDRSKSMLMQTLLRNGGAIYASAWRRHAEDTIDDLQRMDKGQQTAIIEANRGGLPLEPIDEAFEGSFIKLVEMVQYLSAPKVPALSRDAAAEHAEGDGMLDEQTAAAYDTGAKPAGPAGTSTSGT